MSAESKTASSGTPNPTVKTTSPKPDEKASGITTPSSELHAELSKAKEDLKKANKKLASLQKQNKEALKQLKKLEKSSKEEKKKLDDARKKSEIFKSELGIIKGEKSKVVDELEASRIALEILKEALLSIQLDMKSVMEAKDEKCGRVIGGLPNSVEPSEHDYRDLISNMEKRELYLTNALKRSEEEKSCMAYEISRLTSLLKKIEKESKAEVDKIRESLMIGRENERKKNDETTDHGSEKDYDVLPKWKSFMQQINSENNGDDWEVDDDKEMWESLKVDERDLHGEDDENDVMMKMKKKKPLLGKIGSLLLKKGE
ncbi:hypothetical protein OROHE_021740 [Orobanche hederae]